MHQTTRKIYILIKIVLLISKLVSIFFSLYIVINTCFSQVSDVEGSWYNDMLSSVIFVSLNRDLLMLWLSYIIIPLVETTEK